MKLEFVIPALVSFCGVLYLINLPSTLLNSVNPVDLDSSYLTQPKQSAAIESGNNTIFASAASEKQGKPPPSNRSSNLLDNNTADTIAKIMLSNQPKKKKKSLPRGAKGEKNKKNAPKKKKKKGPKARPLNVPPPPVLVPASYPDANAESVLPKVLVIYFPQFHRDPLNDQLWGDGFTDWDSLRSAPPENRRGFKIPRPTTFGYYDATNSTIRKKQGELAKQYGVDGFVYHHYWFYDDKYPGPTLHAPLTAMLKDGYPDLPFGLHWVAENWTATWHRHQGNETLLSPDDERDDARLLQQQYFPEEDSPKIVEHYQWLRQFFHHSNYIKMNGKPILQVYRVEDGIHRVIRRLKQLAVEDGFPGLHCTVGQYDSHEELYPGGYGFGKSETLQGKNAVFDRLTHYPYPFTWMRWHVLKTPEWCVERRQVGEPRSDEMVGIVTCFDNTPRRNSKDARIWMPRSGEVGVVQNFKENLFAAFYYHTCCFAEGGDNQFILINAWNEWAEGMVMEPSDTYGLAFLKVLRETKKMFRTCETADLKKLKFSSVDYSSPVFSAR